MDNSIPTLNVENSVILLTDFLGGTMHLLSSTCLINMKYKISLYFSS